MRLLRASTLTIALAAFLNLAACSSGSQVTLDLGVGPAEDTVDATSNEDVAIDGVSDLSTDLGSDIEEDLGPEPDTLDCDKVCETFECGAAGPEGECDCGECEVGYGCLDGVCTAECGTLCEGIECGFAGAEDECDCGGCDDENACTVDTCEEGVCVLVAVMDGEACDDGVACTVDACEAGECHGTLKDCDDENYCTDDSCEPDTGDCLNIPNTLFCDDADPCTLNDVCVDGVCTGTEVDCTCEIDADCEPLEDGDLCNGTLFCDVSFLPWQCAVIEDSIVECPDPEDGPDAACLQPSCDAETAACSFIPDNEGEACSDEDACTAGDACTEGVCGGTAITCDDANPCTDDTCDSETGCVFTPNDMNICDDGNDCTIGDHCLDGACLSTGTDICDDANPCTTDYCDPALGCQHTDNTIPCDDGDACTTQDTCFEGACVGVTAVCDDNNPCTDDTCAPETGCVYTNNTEPCDDANTCTTDDTCAGGICTGTGDLDCDDQNPCTKDICLPDGGCDYENLTGPVCDDEDPCTIGDACVDGTCGQGEPKNCDDLNPCTDDSCDDLGSCVHAPNTAACTDDNACTEGDHCADGVCVYDGLTDCDDGNVCTNNWCDPDLGCQSSDNTAPCDDGDACTMGDLCAAGVCAGSSITCDDGNVCTDDSCDPDTGCVFSNNTADCDDDDLCTEDDVCADGECAGTDKDCSGLDSVCTEGVCDPDDGDCLAEPANEDGGCDDMNACTDADHCVAGACIGTALDCDDGNPCTDDACDTDTGCTNTNNTASCDDGNACTVTDVCVDGVCSGSGAPDCDDGNICTDDSCDPDTGCVNAFNTASCDDGNACNVTDACLNGVCVGTGVVNCDDSNLCTDDTCDADTGCVFTDNTNPCEDGDLCTAGDVCGGGACQSGTDTLDCDDGVGCTIDGCDPDFGCVNTAVHLDCDDSVDCTDDVCDLDLGCVNTTVDLNCDDGVDCTVDVCDPVLGCVYTPVDLNCDDSVACTVDVCDPVLGCFNTPTLPNGILFDEDFSAPAPDWTLDGEWEFGPAVPGPTCGTGGQDPASDHTDTVDEALAGVVIGGCYGTGLHGYHCLTTPAVDTEGYDELELTYWRWLHSDYTPYVHNKVEVFDGASWQIIWQTGGSPFFHDSGWTEMNHDLSAHANAALQVRWCFNVGNDGVIAEAGWSLDDVAIWGSGDFFCDDDNDCTDDVCDPVLGCINTPVVAYCDDGVACTLDVCDPVLGCINTPVDLNCDDSVACTVDVCDPVLGCFNTPTLPNGILFDEDFSAPAPDWTLDGEWEFGPAVPGPTCGTGGQDPASDHTDTVDEALAGVVIGGCYGTGLHGYHCLTTPAVDTEGYDELELTYWRWLHSDYTPYVHNKVEVFDGASWQIIWQTGGSPFFHDSGWTEMNHDLSAHANAALQVRWCFNVGNDGVIAEAGWSLDDVAIWGSGDFFCDDDNDCTDDVCDPVLGCVNTPVGTYCDDGVACTLDVCDPVLGCINTPVDLDCDDGDKCTDDVCDPVLGCVNSEILPCCGNGVTEPPFEECDDGNEIPGDGCENDCTNTVIATYHFKLLGEVDNAWGGGWNSNTVCAASNVGSEYVGWKSAGLIQPSDGAGPFNLYGPCSTYTPGSQFYKYECVYE